MGFELGTIARDAGYDLLAFDTLGSTNAEALTRARAGETAPVWFVTRHLTAGRGRRGRAWETPSGNLAASLLITVDAGRSLAATLGFVAGLALSEAIRTIVPDIVDARDGSQGAGLTLKWPNDVLADGAKVAGILLEVDAIGDGRLAVVIGLGVNVEAVPDGLPYAAASLKGLGGRVSADRLLSALADAWVGFHAIWDEGRGLSEIRRLWLAQASGLGAPVAVQLGDDILRGTFETLDEDGRLIVLTADGTRRTIAAGEVHFGAAATAVPQ